MTLAEPNWTVIVEPEGDGFIGRCPEFDVASQGATAAEARDNAREAVELLLETADSAEIAARRRSAADE
jgi:predicted RNase H-like HicB family nuclease